MLRHFGVPLQILMVSALTLVLKAIVMPRGWVLKLWPPDWEGNYNLNVTADGYIASRDLELFLAKCDLKNRHLGQNLYVEHKHFNHELVQHATGGGGMAW